MKQFQSFFHSKTALIAVICLLTVLALFAGGCSAQTADGSQKPADAAAPSETPETAAPTETSTSEEQAAPGRIRLIGRSGVRIRHGGWRVRSRLRGSGGGGFLRAGLWGKHAGTVNEQTERDDNRRAGRHARPAELPRLSPERIPLS